MDENARACTAEKSGATDKGTAPIALVTGFEPFGGEETNPSWEAVRLLPDVLCGMRVERRLLPVSFVRAGETLVSAIEELEPQVVLCVGQASGRTCLTVERVAVNVCDARAADNDGVAPAGLPVVEGGPDALFATIPVRSCVDAALAAGVPAAVSNTAGTYVCNSVLYRALATLPGVSPSGMAGFVHVPLSTGQACRQPERASMQVEVMARGLSAILSAITTSAAGGGISG